MDWIGTADFVDKIFLYGGDYVLGASAAELYNGQILADTQDVIVVSLKYVSPLFTTSVVLLTLPAATA